MLQEVGHRWCAFTGFKFTVNGDVQYDLLIQLGEDADSHWNSNFDNDQSPMDYDQIDWEELLRGIFEKKMVMDNESRYCDLDLYLMGLLSPEKVPPFYYLQNLRKVEGNRYYAHKKQLNIQNVIWAEGKHEPVSQPTTHFKHAFVLRTKDYGQSISFAKTLNHFRKEYNKFFFQATREKAKVDTTLGMNGQEKHIGGDITQTYNCKVSIPDREDTDGIIEPLEIPLSFAEKDPVKSGEISFDIKHVSIEDLKIELVGPYRTTEVTLYDRNDPERSKIKETYKVSEIDKTCEDLDLSKFKNKSATGNWILRITDLIRGNPGTSIPGA